jgi:hypothetical protein
MFWLAPVLTVAVVVQDQTAMRASPAVSAPRQAVLWQGDWLEVRGEHKGYLKVWDHRHERPGYVRPWQVRRYTLDESAAPALRAVVSFLEDTPGAEALGIAHVALYLKAAPAGSVGPDLFASLGGMADRLARRASTKRAGPGDAALAAHLEVVATYGVKLVPFEREEGTKLCYDGEAHQRVLALPGATAEARAKAALALSDLGCVEPNLQPMAIEEVLRWRLAVLDRIPAAEAPPLLANRLRLRRAALRAEATFYAARRGDAGRAESLGRGAWEDLARVEKAELPEDELALLDETAVRVGAARWSWAPPPPASKTREVVLAPRAPGETCIRVHDGTQKGKTLLVERCTYALVHARSVRISPRGQQVAVAVQSLPGWTEVLLFHKDADTWVVDPIVPAATTPELGYAEVAGWPSDETTVFLVREARVEGRLSRRFQQVAADTLAVKKEARTAAGVPGFRRWQAPSWVESTLALR